MPLKRVRKAPGRKKRARQASLAGLKRKAWKLLSEVVRREAAVNHSDYSVSCYTCGRHCDHTGIQAGHAIGGRTGAVLLDEELIRPQCVQCNIFLRGNYPVFVAKLIKEKALGMSVANNGMLAMDWWEGKLQSSRQVRKWSRQDLEEKIESYKARLEKL